MRSAMARWRSAGLGMGPYTLLDALEDGLAVTVPDSRRGILVKVGRAPHAVGPEVWEAIVWPWHPEGGRVVGPGVPPPTGATIVEDADPAVVAAAVEYSVDPIVLGAAVEHAARGRKAFV